MDRDRAVSDIVVTVPAGTPTEEISRIHAIFPDAGFVAPAAAAPAPSLDDALAAAVVAAKTFPADLASAMAAAGGLTAILYMLAAIGAGLVAEWVVRLTALKGLSGDVPGAAGGRLRDRAPRAARYVASRLIALAVFTLVAFMVGRLLHSGQRGPRSRPCRDHGDRLRTHRLSVRRGQCRTFRAATPPDGLYRRSEARVVQRAGLGIAIAVGVIGTLRGFVTMAVGTDPSGELARLVLAVALGAATILFFTAIRRPLGSLIGRSLASDGEAKPGWGTRIARRTVTLFIVLVVLDVVVKCLGALGLLGAAAASGAGSTVFLLVLAPLVIAGIRIWVGELDDEREDPDGSGRFRARGGRGDRRCRLAPVHRVGDLALR